jgi:hypothetical protein
MNELKDRHHCVTWNWFFYGAQTPTLAFGRVCNFLARKLPVSTAGFGSAGTGLVQDGTAGSSDQSGAGRPTAVFRLCQLELEKQPFKLNADRFRGGHAICVCGQESRAHPAGSKIPSNLKQPGPRSEDASRVVS